MNADKQAERERIVKKALDDYNRPHTCVDRDRYAVRKSLGLRKPSETYPGGIVMNERRAQRVYNDVSSDKKRNY